MKLILIPRRLNGNVYFQYFAEGLNEAGVEDIRLSDVLRLRTSFDAIHAHYPEHLVTEGSWIKAAVGASFFLIFCTIARLFGKPLIWMVHDVHPARDNRPRASAMMLSLLYSIASGFIFLSDSSRLAFFAKYAGRPEKPWAVARHGRYRTYPLSEERRTEIASQLGLRAGEVVVSFLGDIRPKKGTHHLPAIPLRLPRAGRDVTLLVAGRVEYGAPEIVADNQLPDRAISRMIRVGVRLSDEELSHYAQMSDVALMPYIEGSNSGVALNLLSNQTRLLCSNLPMFLELRSMLGAPWVYCADFNDVDAVREALEAAACATVSDADKARLEAFLEMGDYAANGRTLRTFYQSLMRRKG